MLKIEMTRFDLSFLAHSMFMVTLSGLTARIGCMQFDMEICYSAKHAQWLNPENRGAARHLAIKITIKIEFCRGA